MSFGQRHSASNRGRSQAKPADPLLGRQLDKYILDERIGVGGSGAVYRGRHAVLGRAFAVKVLRADLLTDQESKDRFKREVDVLAELNHPNIVSLVDAGYEEGVGPYMVMEWLEGTTLFAERRRRQQLEVDDILVLFEQLCDALAFIHRRGLIHRDLKPENIMLLESTGDDPHDLKNRRLKVFDFGIVLMNEGEDNRLTAAGMVVGTPHYMAPEQILIDADVDHRADLYAAGAILFELLAGRPPFGDQQQPLEVMKRHVSKPAPQLSEVAPHRSFPPGLQEVLNRSLAKKPEERFQDARELFAALRQTIAPVPGAPVVPLTPLEPQPDPNAHLFEATRQVESPFTVDDFKAAAQEAATPMASQPPSMASQPPPAASPFSPAGGGSPFAGGSSPFASTQPGSPVFSSPAAVAPVAASPGVAPATPASPWGAMGEVGGGVEEDATRVDVTVPPDLLASIRGEAPSEPTSPSVSPGDSSTALQEQADALLYPSSEPAQSAEPRLPSYADFAPPPPPPVPGQPAHVATLNEGTEPRIPEPTSVGIARPSTPPPESSSPGDAKTEKSAKAPGASVPAKKKKSSKIKFWVIGGVISILLGVVAFFILQYLQN